jgi:hypothetical protein
MCLLTMSVLGFLAHHSIPVDDHSFQPHKLTSSGLLVCQNILKEHLILRGARYTLKSDVGLEAHSEMCQRWFLGTSDLNLIDLGSEGVKAEQKITILR